MATAATKAAAAGVGVRWQRCSHIIALVACFESLTFTPATGGAWLRTCGISTAKAEVIPVDRQAIKTRNIAACLRNMAAAVEGHAVFLSAGFVAAAVNAVPPKEISGRCTSKETDDLCIDHIKETETCAS